MGVYDASGEVVLVSQVLEALGGEGTVGDIVVLSGLRRAEVDGALHRLLADGRAQIKVSASGEVVYHLEAPPEPSRSATRGFAPGRAGLPERRPPPSRLARLPFDRKTLRLIRAREGVLSLAELVEHTGLPLREAEREMARLAEWYGGEPRASLDDHVVWAFPDLMSSVHGRFSLREPRPAWVRFDDPVHPRGGGRGRATLRVAGTFAGGLGAVVVPGAGWAAGMAGAPLLGVSVLAGVALATFGVGFVRAIRSHRAFRFRERRSLRRYVLGHVFETALAGKGVVSLERAHRYLQARAGRTRIRRSAVEGALRQLAGEFGAPVTREGRDLFFGFRNVKRQFLASELVRRRLRLGRVASGDTVFDTADSPGAATARELAAFDRELQGGSELGPVASP